MMIYVCMYTRIVYTYMYSTYVCYMYDVVCICMLYVLCMILSYTYIHVNLSGRHCMDL